MADFINTGILIHARPDWPCASCRPGTSAHGRKFLCLECADLIVSAAVKRMGATGSEALGFLEAFNALDGDSDESEPTEPWELPWTWFPARR